MIQVLLVEDDPMVAELNRLYLGRIPGFELVASARSAAEALDLLRTHTVDLLLLDIFMPGQSGLELMADIRRQALDMDVIFVTAARDAVTIDRALKLGAVDYLSKPFDDDELQSPLVHQRGDRPAGGHLPGVGAEVLRVPQRLEGPPHGAWLRHRRKAGPPVPVPEVPPAGGPPVPVTEVPVTFTPGSWRGAIGAPLR